MTGLYSAYGNTSPLCSEEVGYSLFLIRFTFRLVSKWLRFLRSRRGLMTLLADVVLAPCCGGLCGAPEAVPVGPCAKSRVSRRILPAAVVVPGPWAQGASWDASACQVISWSRVGGHVAEMFQASRSEHPGGHSPGTYAGADKLSLTVS